MSYVSDYSKGRDNNFNLLRAFFSILVVCGHGYNIITDLEYDGRPWIQGLYDVGFSALDAFFVFSGFMLVGSIIRRRDLVEFAIARLFRIFPALIAVAFVTAFIIGPMVTSVSLYEYFSSLTPFNYFLVTGFTSIDQSLIGVFIENPASGAVNIPLWTLKYELAFYVATAVAFSFGIFRSKFISLWFAAILFTYLAKIFTLGVNSDYPSIDHLFRFAFCFAVGSAAYVYQDKIRLNFRIFVILGLSLYLLYDTPIAQATQAIFVTYFIFWMGYIPTGKMRAYNKVGDYSYAIYIWHWPVASTLLIIFPYISSMQLIATTLAITIPVAVLSWQFIEMPALLAIKNVTAGIKVKFINYRGAKNEYATKN